MDNSEDKALLEAKHKTYLRRWLVLAYTCCVYMSASIGWNTWGPIVQSLEYVYGWDDSTIADIMNVSRAAMLMCLIPICYMLDHKGIRFTFILCQSLGVIGHVLRCFLQLVTLSATWLGILSHVFVALGTVIVYSSPSLVASVWFPVHERTSATAIGVISLYIGYGVCYVAEPQIVSAPVLVPAPGNNMILNTSYDITSLKTPNADVDNTSSGVSYVVSNLDTMASEVISLIYIEAAIAAVFLIIGVTLLPRAPPTPPSSSAAVTRINYTSVFMGLVKNGFLCLLSLTVGTLVGSYASWVSIISIALEPLEISQEMGGWLGFYISIASGGVSFVSARIADKYRRKSHIILLMMLTVSSLSFLWLSLLCGKYIPHHLGQIYASSIIGSAFRNGCFPLLYEQLCERAFPIPEGIIMGLMSLVTNVAGIIYLLPLSLIPDKDTSWLEWALLGTGLVGIVVILVTPQRYGRADMDLAVTVRTDVKYAHLDSDTTKEDAERDVKYEHLDSDTTKMDSEPGK